MPTSSFPTLFLLPLFASMKLKLSPVEAMHWIAPSEKDTDYAALENRL